MSSLKKENVENLTSKANKFFQTKEYDKAIELYLKAIKRHPELKDYLDFNIKIAEKLNNSNNSIKPSSSISTQCNYEIKIEKANEELISGWVVDTENKDAVLSIDIEVNGIFYSSLKSNIRRSDLKKHKKTTGLGGFELNLPKQIFNKDKNYISIILPSGRKVDHYIENSYDKEIDYYDFSFIEENVSVIVPIYNALEDLKICVERLRHYTDNKVKVFLINDASPDPNIDTFLKSIENYKQFIIIQNDNNLGFTKTVNKGIKLCGEDNVVILNSDARVTPLWLDSLSFAASTDKNIATVTPMSDRAGAFSAPDIGNGNDLPHGVSEIEYSLAFRRNSLGLYPTVPTGNGFCMYIRRSCINAIGEFDQTAFPRGYGEENDFCMRARENGWRNIIDDKTYIFHDRSKSFGEAKNDLMAAGRKVIDSRYPDYKKAISTFKDNPKIKAARYQARKAANDCETDTIKHRCLFVVSTKTGGTPQTNRDLMLALDDSIEPWLLHCDSQTITLYKVGKEYDEVVFSHKLLEKVDPLTHNSSEYDKIVYGWIFRLGFSIVHIRHLVWHSLGLIKVAKLAGAKVVKSFHDYYALCPTVKLLDDDFLFCRGNCSNSISNKDCSFPLWESDALPPLKNNWIYNWREKFSKALKNVDRFVTTSQHAKNIFIENLPEIDFNKFKVIKHGRDFDKFVNPSKGTIAKSRYRILVPGNIDEAKGLNVILSLLEEDTEGLLEFHILGNARQALLKKASDRLVFHGTYSREEFSQHVLRIKPDVGAVFSIWDETWCHTLTELFSVGLPVFVMDFPTVSDRVKEYNAGWVLENNEKSLFSQIKQSLLMEINDKLHGVKAWQDQEGKFRNIRWMAAQYHALYQEIYNGSDLSKTNLTNKITGLICPGNKKQSRGGGSSYVRVWERTINKLESNSTYCRVTSEQLMASFYLDELKNIVVQRNALTPGEVNSLVAFSNKKKIKYLLDLDDDLLNVPKTIDVDSKYCKYRPYLKKLIGNANIITVSTEEIKESLKKYSDNVYVLENKISERLWKERPKFDSDSDSDSDSNVVLYIGTRTHKKDYEYILPYMEKVANLVPDFEFRVIGILDSNDKVPSWVNKVDVPSDKVEYPDFVQWVKNQTLGAVVGIAPLVNTDFNSHKSCLKALEYAAIGLPVIVSDVPSYKPLKRVMKGIIYVDNLDEFGWVNAIMHRLNDKAASKSLGFDNMKIVFDKYSLLNEEDKSSFGGLLDMY